MDMVIEQHSRFFDHLADLIPLKHFHEHDNQHIQVRFLGKRQRAEAIKAIKQQGRQQKKAKLDPDKALTTLQFQRMQLQKAHKHEPLPQNEGTEQEERSTAAEGYTLDHRTGSREDLVERLHERLQQAKKQRETTKQKRPEPNKAAQKAKDFQQQMRQQTQKKLQSSSQQDDSNRKASKKAPDGLPKQSTAPASTKPTAAAEPKAAFTFGLVDVGDGKAHVGKKAHKKPSTVELLKEAEAKQKLQQTPTADEQAKAREEAWQAALRRARGEKVLDDPKLLRKTLRKEKQLKRKSSQTWQQRMDGQQEQRQAKQDKRQNNLAVRSKTKLDNRKAKREKKLLRPGFEGRKNDFIAVKKS